MAARLIEETDIIDVSNPPVLLFGQPGSGKTSLAQTASNPITLDFDGGVHRSAFRRRVLRMEAWEDVIDVQRNGIKGKDGKFIMGPNFEGHPEVVIDTVGTCLRLMGKSIIAGNAKMGTRQGALSMQGWGALKELFDGFVAGLRASGKQLIMIAHEKEDKDGDQRVIRPDIQGGSYAIVTQNADLVGYVSFHNGSRWAAWDPCDTHFAKNGGNLPSQAIPDFATNPQYFAGLLAMAKANLGKTAAASAAVAKAADEWQDRLEAGPDLDAFNEMLPGLKGLGQAAKTQAWNMCQAYAKKSNWTFDKTSNKFVAPTASEEPKSGKGKKKPDPAPVSEEAEHGDAFEG